MSNLWPLITLLSLLACGDKESDTAEEEPQEQLDSGAEDSGSEEDPEDSGSEEEPEKTSAGCSSVGGGPWLWWAGLLVVFRCRFESPSKCLPPLRRKAPR